MSYNRFIITRLALTGLGLKDAELFFSNGLNVITGPSDTGKTFVFECIDFMFGASTPPKSIPEADKYDTVCLDILVDKNKKKYSLTRSLKGGLFQLVTDDGEEKVLKEHHAVDDKNSISQFLLELINLQDKRIRIKKDGKTRSFSFRDMAHLSIISEEDIIKKNSPILSGQYTTSTAEKSAYSFLLSETDDSSIIQKICTKNNEKRYEAKEEILKELIAKTEHKIEKLQIKTELPSLAYQLANLDISIHKFTEYLNEAKGSVMSLEESRRTAWARMKQVESRIDVLSELHSRFSLLHQQYQSDIDRLHAITESGKRLGEMRLNYCPVCGASSEAQNRDHQEYQVDPVTVAESCITEISNINKLVVDLEETQKDINNEIEELECTKTQAIEDLKKANYELQNHLNPKISNILDELQIHQELREKIYHAVSLYEQLNELEEMLNKIGSMTSEKTDKAVFAELDILYMESFAKVVQERLKAWKFPSLDRVTFDTKEWDIVLSGRSRSSHGKGIRAVTHAAFTLSLLKYCSDNNHPHSGIVVIDSPLVVYKQPDAGEENFSIDVKTAFFYDLSQTFKDSQVIIIENESPPDDLVSIANIIRFTGTNQGRRGFIPSSKIVE